MTAFHSWPSVQRCQTLPAEPQGTWLGFSSLFFGTIPLAISALRSYREHYSFRVTPVHHLSFVAKTELSHNLHYVMPTEKKAKNKKNALLSFSGKKAYKNSAPFDWIRLIGVYGIFTVLQLFFRAGWDLSLLSDRPLDFYLGLEYNPIRTGMYFFIQKGIT